MKMTQRVIDDFIFIVALYRDIKLKATDFLAYLIQRPIVLLHEMHYGESRKRYYQDKGYEEYEDVVRYYIEKGYILRNPENDVPTHFWNRAGVWYKII